MQTLLWYFVLEKSQVPYTYLHTWLSISETDTSTNVTILPSQLKRGRNYLRKDFWTEVRSLNFIPILRLLILFSSLLANSADLTMSSCPASMKIGVRHDIQTNIPSRGSKHESNSFYVNESDILWLRVFSNMLIFFIITAHIVSEKWLWWILFEWFTSTSGKQDEGINAYNCKRHSHLRYTQRMP